MKKKTPLEVISDKYRVEGDCWLWTGCVNKSHGYGSTWNGKRAHRLSYEAFHNVSLTPDQVVRHTCDVKHCINPDHLLLGTQADNVQDKVDRDRQAKGVEHGMAKLSEDDVLLIRWMLEAGCTEGEVAMHFSLSGTHVNRIRDRKSWRHI